MTLRQEAVRMVNNIPEDSLQVIIDMMRNIIPSVTVRSKDASQKVDTTKRFGAGIGVMNDPPGFDDMNDAVLDYFESAGII